MPRRKGFTLVEAIVVLIIAAVLVALLFPAIRAARETAPNRQCVNYIKQLALAFHNYHDTYLVTLPAAFTVDAEDKPLYGWRVPILPFIECQKLYDDFQRNESWESPANQALINPRPIYYACPMEYRFQGQPDDCAYAMVVGPNTISDGPHSVSFANITDGTSNTLLLAETRKSIPWPSPLDISFDSLGWGILKQDDSRALTDGICSRHVNDMGTIALADGSVRSLPQTISPDILKALATINDGESVKLP